MNEIYCKGCLKRVNKGILGFKAEKYYTFEDGTYCEKCAKIIIEKRRKKIDG